MKKLALILISALLTAPVFGYDFSSFGYTAGISSESATTYTDASGNSFTLTEDAGISDEIASRIADFMDKVILWENIFVKSIAFSETTDGFECIIIPVSVLSEGEELISTIPSGFYFYYDEEGLSYNFRMLEDSYFMTVKGFYINEATLIEKMKSAQDDPVSYIQREDFDYVLSKIDSLDTDVSGLELEIFETVEDLTAQIAEMQTALDDLSGENLELKMAIVSLVNHGALSSKPSEITEELVDKIIELKTETPALTVEEAYEKASSAGIECSKREVLYIFVIFYNEFE